MHSLTFPGTFFQMFTVVFVHLVQLWKPEYGTCLGSQKLLHFQLSNMHSPTFSGISTNSTYIYVGTSQNIYSNVKDSEHFDKFVLQNQFAAAEL